VHVSIQIQISGFQGLTEVEAIAMYGEDKVKHWRGSASWPKLKFESFSAFF